MLHLIEAPGKASAWAQYTTGEPPLVSSASVPVKWTAMPGDPMMSRMQLVDNSNVHMKANPSRRSEFTTGNGKPHLLLGGHAGHFVGCSLWLPQFWLLCLGEAGWSEATMGPISRIPRANVNVMVCECIQGWLHRWHMASAANLQFLAYHWPKPKCKKTWCVFPKASFRAEITENTKNCVWLIQ